MIRVVICDDEIPQLEAIHASVRLYFSERRHIQAEIRDFSSPAALTECLESEEFDIVLLDIYMQELNGIELAGKLCARNENVQLIFLSSSKEFAVDAFALHAAHYIVKPFSQAQLEEAMARALTQLSASMPKKVSVSGENGVVHIINAEDILYIESIGYRRFVHTAGAEHTELRRTLSGFMEELELLQPGQFIIPYRGYIVNLNAIRTVTPKSIVMQDGTSIPIKSGDFRKLRDMLFAWAFRPGGGINTDENFS